MLRSTSLIDETICSVAVAVSSTERKSVSVWRLTSSVDAAISSIDAEVSSEAAESDSTFSVIFRTPLFIWSIEL